ncbi:serine hydrolase domain-containing protein [Jiangella alba]|uniref:D-alanyl-D-alanine carboxypeptidase n=1 Tax=Jiangella alba TaxID=561176 RepID=A0A1H5LH79_9ACTN|nr:serine hydrolase domain-containing protein [Jiangella alba]SEE76422.1 D-alanyl-D-alanine carboxypeptidase [Jiangella alba]
MRRPLPIAVLSAATLLCAAAVPAGATDHGLDVPALERALAEVHEAGAPGAVVEVRDGDEVWSAAAGDRDPTDHRPEPVEPTDLVRIGSVTKSMLTTVVLQLVDEGRLGLDDPVAEHLPDVLPYDEPITVRQLLSHTGGVPDFFLDLFPSLAEGSPADVESGRLRVVRPERLVDIATSRPLDFVPGDSMSYSNTGFIVVGLLVEQLTGNPVEDELKRRVFEPAGLADTSMPRVSPVIRGEHPHAFLATPDPDRPLLDTTRISPTLLWSAGAVISTTADVNTFFRAMFDGTLLPADLLAQALTLTPQSEGSYGLGIQAMPAQCAPVEGGVAYGHTGSTLGFVTYAFSSPDGERQVSVAITVEDLIARNDELSAAVDVLIGAGLCAQVGVVEKLDRVLG